MYATAIRIGHVFGIPVRVHITLLIILPVMALNYAWFFTPPSVFWGLFAAIGLFASIVLHEAGHSLVAAHAGCPARDILLLPIGGLAQLECLPRRPADEFRVAIAGPAVSLFLAITLGLIGAMSSALGFFQLGRALSLLGSINLMLVLFNLLPSFPMDGGRIFRAWLTPYLGRLTATRVASSLGRFIAILLGIYGVIRFNIFLVFIAVFIYQAAGAEYRMVRIQEAGRERWSGPWISLNDEWPYDEGEVIVSPPPYERRSPMFFIVRPLRMQHDVFDELFDKWR